MDMTLVVVLLIALVLTILIELGVLLLLGERQKRVLCSSVVVNVLTNVPLNIILYYTTPTAISSTSSRVCGKTWRRPRGAKALRPS